ncbi:MAG: hypothetical protein KGL39_08205 [Patescibacteria group bacterium]|nr:hypothetical protein [Patescibacteria group bacterium]
MPKYANPENTYPSKEGDLIKEMLVAFVFVSILITVLALVFKSPFDPPVTIKQIAESDPVLFEQTAMRDLMGTSAIATYGPPYNSGPAQQSLGWFSPERWGGVSIPINASELYVTTPLKEASNINPDIQKALSEFNSATDAQKGAWEDNYYAALQNATATAGTVSVPNGDYGPVSPMMNYLLGLGKSGFMDSSLNSGGEYNNGVYTYSFARSLLFLQGEALSNIAAQKGLLGSQLGIARNLSPYPGPWWLLIYSYLYQIPPYSTAAAGDLLVALTMLGVFLVILFLPFIPVLNKIPYYIPVYKVIWRRWYKRQNKQ